MRLLPELGLVCMRLPELRPQLFTSSGIAVARPQASGTPGERLSQSERAENSRPFHHNSPTCTKTDQLPANSAGVRTWHGQPTGAECPGSFYHPTIDGWGQPAHSVHGLPTTKRRCWMTRISNSEITQIRCRVPQKY